jgi:hypothetical protein
MKNKITVSLIIIGVLGVVTYLATNFLCEIGVKCKNCTRTSMSKEQSKKNGLYLMDYKPLKEVIQLRNHDETITFDEVWIESQWFYNSNNCLNKHLEKREGYNIIFEFEKSNERTFLFSLTPVSNGKMNGPNGGIQETQKEIQLNEITDTLWLRIHEKNPQEEIGWKEELEGELISFIKK